MSTPDITTLNAARMTRAQRAALPLSASLVKTPQFNRLSITAECLLAQPDTPS